MKKKISKKSKTKVKYRPPVIALLGHVDHGKTTILDKIRESSEQEKEVGGITQKISSWSVDYEGKDITFIDTPGHEAFDLMRKRGGEVADIVVLVVAVNDGVKPQTKESIEIVKSTGTPAIVALNKTDISGIDKEKVKRELSDEGIVVESLGGDVPCIEVSGKTGKGIPELLEMINLVAQMHKISKKDSQKGTLGEGFILESYRDKSLGNVSSLVVTSGSFSKGMYVAYKDDNVVVEKIRSLMSSDSKQMSTVDQGYSVRIIGLSCVLDLGQKVYCMDSARAETSGLFIANKNVSEEKDAVESDLEPVDKDASEESLSEESPEEDLLAMLLGAEVPVEEEVKSLKIVLRSNSQGTHQAILKSLESIGNDDCKLEVVKSEVGNITVGDVELAKNIGAVVIGFGVSFDSVASDFASKNKVLVKTYDLIYDLVDELEDAVNALQQPGEVEETVGSGKVKQIFTLSNGSRVVGVRVGSGEMKHGLNCRILRGEDEIGNGKITSMRQEKDKVTSAGKGIECGLVIDFKGDIEKDDTVECYRIVKT